MSEYYEDDDINYSIRFFSISPEKVTLIKNIVPINNFNKRKDRKDQSLYTVVVDLVEDLDFEAIERLVHENFKSVDYDIFVSMTTESESEIFDVPSYVINLLRSIGGKLIFSFTFINNQD